MLQWNSGDAEAFTSAVAITRLPENPKNETSIVDRRRRLCIRGNADAIRFRNAARCG
jgi:hypothetical protein